MIGEYTREFKARVQMCKNLNSDIGPNIKLQKGVSDEQQVRYMDMLGGTLVDDKAKWKKINQTAREQYLSMLYFDGLNRNAYGDLHNKIHKAYRLGELTRC